MLVVLNQQENKKGRFNDCRKGWRNFKFNRLGNLKWNLILLFFTIIFVTLKDGIFQPSNCRRRQETVLGLSKKNYLNWFKITRMVIKEIFYYIARMNNKICSVTLLGIIMTRIYKKKFAKFTYNQDLKGFAKFTRISIITIT